MQLNPSEISELIKSRIQGIGGTAEVRNQGTVISVTDGICRIHGLSDAMQGEMLEFPATKDGAATFGLAGRTMEALPHAGQLRGRQRAAGVLHLDLFVAHAKCHAAVSRRIARRVVHQADSAYP